MRGDKLVIQEWHISAARGAAELITSQILESSGKFTITIAGESGSGKSEIAEALSDALAEHGIKCLILQQDDYFVYPPHTNARKREEDIEWVGMGEVKLDLLDQNLADIKSGKTEIQKPLVIFDEDRAIEESMPIGDNKVAIAEGTYTTSLKNTDCRIFIDRTYHDTKKARALRGRDKQDEYLERILEIEHKIISSHKPLADIIVTSDYGVEKNG
ncbi:MAG: zeta toxin family protein [Chloroflexota bacterium]|nr:zeta toxin family protein [Chloroflexota bacterium]